MKNSQVIITQVSQFNRNVVTFNAQGVLGAAVPGQTSFIDLKMEDDNFLTGGALTVKNAFFGDACSLQVVDLDGIFAPAGAVLNQFVTNWYMNDLTTKQADFDLPYPAKIFADLYIRLVYKSASPVDGKIPAIAVNYNLHKALL